MTLCLLALRKTCGGKACFGEQLGSKLELDIVNGSLCKLCALVLGLALHISLHNADESQEVRNSCPLLILMSFPKRWWGKLRNPLKVFGFSLQIQCSSIPEESFESTNGNKLTFIPCSPTLVVWYNFGIFGLLLN